jgi:hypothetical protein
VIEPPRQERSRDHGTAERSKIQADRLEQEAREAGARTKLTTPLTPIANISLTAFHKSASQHISNPRVTYM